MQTQAFLNRLRNQYLETEDPQLLFNNQACTINGTDYRLNGWQDFFGKEAVVVFELKHNNILATESMSLGIRYSQSGDTTLLDQAQLRSMNMV